MSDDEIKTWIRTMVQIMAKAALDLFQHDQHRFSSRPCATCKQISSLIGEPWGCEKINASNKG